MTGAFLPRPKRSGYPALFYDEIVIIKIAGGGRQLRENPER